MSSHLVVSKTYPQRLVRDTVVRARVNSDLKDAVEEILCHLGLTMSEAINLCLSQIKLNNGVPFEVKIPNAVTAKAIREARVKKGVVVCKDAKDMFEKLEI